MNERRRNLVLQAFQILDADKSGVVELNDIMAKYDASKHPDVKTGKRTKEDVLSEFLDTFDTEEKDGKVTPNEFCKYYSNVSSSIDDDDYFELMIRNAWHISGGEGWCANSSNRRVLCVHKDGRQTVEEIKVRELCCDARNNFVPVETYCFFPSYSVLTVSLLSCLLCKYFHRTTLALDLRTLKK